MSQMNTNDLRKAKRWLRKRKNWFGINAKSICEECVEKQIPEIVKAQETPSDIIKYSVFCFKKSIYIKYFNLFYFFAFRFRQIRKFRFNEPYSVPNSTREVKHIHF